MHIGIAVDNWKVSIFKKHLKKAGYIVREKGDGRLGVIVLSVKINETEEAIHALATVVAAAQRETSMH